MTLDQLINDKIGRKQIITVIAIIALQGEPYLQAMIAAIGILGQLVIDYKKGPRENGE